MKKIWVLLVFVAMLVLMAAFAQPAKAESCYRGESFGWTAGHHYVVFSGVQGTPYSVRYTADPVFAYILQPGLWPGPENGVQKAGFHWMDWWSIGSGYGLAWAPSGVWHAIYPSDFLLCTK